VYIRFVSYGAAAQASRRTYICVSCFLVLLVHQIVICPNDLDFDLLGLKTVHPIDLIFLSLDSGVVSLKLDSP
jgi:hypothetical protein